MIFCSFGDMLRVPGIARRPVRGQERGRRRPHRLLPARRVEARPRPPRPAGRLLRASASRRRRRPTRWRSSRPGGRASTNFSLLVSHVLVPPAIAAILESPTNRVQAFLAAGHVCAVMGTSEYEPLAEKYARADRRHRLRAARPARGDPQDRRPARGGTPRAGERVPPRRAGRGQPGGGGDAARRLRGQRPHLARHRDDPRERVAALAPVRRLRRRAALRGHRHPDRRVAAVSLR